MMKRVPDDTARDRHGRVAALLEDNIRTELQAAKRHGGPRPAARSHRAPRSAWLISTIRYNLSMEHATEAAGALLRRARARARLSQTELAARAGVSQSVVSAYESGHRQPALTTLAALIEAAGY